MSRVALAACAAGVLLVACFSNGGGRDEFPADRGRWFKGNTHTHTLWSDGDGAPELVAAWYRERDYDFLVLSDHNLLSRGERWFPISESGRLTEERVSELVEAFGADAVELRDGDDGREMRLVTLEELRARFEAPGEFLFVEGEEITSRYEKHEVHVNGISLVEAIEPLVGETLRETINLNVDAVVQQSEETGRPMLAHLNHPNYKWSIGWEDLAHIRGDRFFEVYNGHPGVRNQGDDTHLGTEAMWDRANTLRLTQLDLPVLFGLATDDSHGYHTWGVGQVNPGRGWVMVRAESLSADAIVTAMQRGDFYSSSGVTVSSVEAGPDRYAVDIESEEGVEYRTRFIGTRLMDGGPGTAGETLLETDADPAVYAFAGDELYVRAVVTSTKLHPNPYAEGDREMAWLQPVVPGEVR